MEPAAIEKHITWAIVVVALIISVASIALYGIEMNHDIALKNAETKQLCVESGRSWLGTDLCVGGIG